jgi:hypothetical protein
VKQLIDKHYVAKYIFEKFGEKIINNPVLNPKENRRNPFILENNPHVRIQTGDDFAKDNITETMRKLSNARS